MYKYILAAFLLLGLYAFSGGEADARVCVKVIAGKCVFWSGSVECELQASGVGNVTKDPKSLGCLIEPQAGSTQITGLVICGNPGSKRLSSPGIQLADFTGTFDAFAPLTPKDVDKNGNATVTTFASLSSTQLATLKTACPNVNWVAKDFVPCSFDTTVDLVDEFENVIDTKSFRCDMPDCSTLQWDTVAQKIERRQYTCDEIVP